MRLIFANDECKPEPAVAVAEEFVQQGVDFVAGHLCSGAGLAASKAYEQAGILMMTGTAASPKLTDQGNANVFRICGRSDQEGLMAALYLAEQWGEKDIAILHDGSTYGQGVAEFTKAYLTGWASRKLCSNSTRRERTTTPMWSPSSRRLASMSFTSADTPRRRPDHSPGQEKGYEPQLVSGKSVGGDAAFGDIAGAAADGTLVTASRDTRQTPEAAQVMAEFRTRGIDHPDIDALYSYALFQVWSQAVAEAGSLDLAKVTEALHSHQFDTVIGKVAFDQNGDVTQSGFEWLVWTKGGPVPKG